MTIDTADGDADDYLGRLIDALQGKKVLHSRRIAAALRAVPRHRYVPTGTDLEQAYADTALVLTTANGGHATSSISQPTIVVVMLEQLAVRPGHRVLEVGTASGWNAALLSRLVGVAGRVVSMEFDPELAATARARLARAGERVEVVAGDGWLGDPDAAPFDRIEVTVGVDDLSPRWVEQLVERGVLVVPLALRPGLELSVAFVRQGDRLVSVSAVACGFVRLRGPHAGEQERMTLPDGTTVVADWLDTAYRDRLAAALTMPPRALGPVAEPPSGWGARLALEQPFTLVVLDGQHRRAVRAGLYDPAGGGVALLDGRTVLSFGDEGAAHQLREWVSRAPPLAVEWLRLTAEPSAAAPPPGDWVLSRTHFTYGIRVPA